MIFDLSICQGSRLMKPEMAFVAKTVKQPTVAQRERSIMTNLSPSLVRDR